MQSKKKKESTDVVSKKLHLLLEHISTLTSLGGGFKECWKDLPLFYEVTKLNTFADWFIKCEKMPLAAICQKLKKEKRAVTQAHQHGVIYPFCLHKHADGSSDGLGRGYPSQATLW